MPGCSAGATATVVIVDLVSRELACCNAGDSSALMVDRTKTSWVSVDHRLQENKSEQERLRDQGARIAYAMNPATKAARIAPATSAAATTPVLSLSATAR